MYLYRYSYNTSIRDIRSTKILLQSKNGYINTRFGILPGRKNTTLFTFECWRAFPIEFGRLRKYAHSYDVTRVSLWKMEAQVKIAKQRKRRGEVLTDSGRKRKKDDSNKRTILPRLDSCTTSSIIVRNILFAYLASVVFGIVRSHTKSRRKLSYVNKYIRNKVIFYG